LLRRTLGEAVALETVLAGGLWHTFADSNQLENAVLNLALNARDAMPTGGKLTIETANCYLDEAYVGEIAEPVMQGQYVMVAVTDTGSGMDKATLEKAFEPFFTTKEVGKGTGLGLSQVYGFAKQSGGTATISSAVGRGTVITLYLPRTRELPAPPVAQVEPEASAQQTGTVLLVEDNAEVAEVTTAYFQQLGYTVKQVANGREALELLGSDPKIDVVCSDILMPGGMNGLDLGRAIAQLYPALPVLLTTGYSSSARDAVAQGFVVLQKPFDLAALERGLREARRWKVEPAERVVG
jgi:CheY-like chemotaxis protein